MDYNQILDQIASLEQVNREKGDQVIQETVKHKATTAKLQKAVEDLQVARDREAHLTEKVSQLQAGLDGAKMMCEQLQGDGKNFKLEVMLIKEHVAKEEEKIKIER